MLTSVVIPAAVQFLGVLIMSWQLLNAWETRKAPNVIFSRWSMFRWCFWFSVGWFLFRYANVLL